MMKRTYYRIDLETKSPLSIGASNSTMTDCDVVLDGQGKPFIPATSLRGVLRSYFSADESVQTHLFGCMKDGKTSEGIVRVYDGTFIKGSNEAVSIRDSVKLKNEDKVAKPGAKFDRQIVEHGAKFRTYIEALGATSEDEHAITEAVSALNAGILRLGAKTTRGMGEVEVTSCMMREFAFDTGNISDASDWLEFDMFGENGWRDAKPVTLQDPTTAGIVIDLALRLKGAISIREYSTEPNQADFVQLFARKIIDSDEGEAPDIAPKENGEDDPEVKRDDREAVVPGASWAGAFRHRYRQFAGEQMTESLFGIVDESTGVIRKSAITFSESLIQGGKPKRLTRNAIDRFTGGTQEGALFTLESHYGGTTNLQMRIAPGHEGELAPLLATILDLHYGFLAVGGLTAVGSGRFEVLETGTSLKANGNEISNFYAELFGHEADENGANSVNIAEFVKQLQANGPEQQEVSDGQ